MCMDRGTWLCCAWEMRFGRVVCANCNCAGVVGCIGSDGKSVRREDAVVRMRDSRGTMYAHPPLIPLNASQPFLHISNVHHRRGCKPFSAAHDPQP
jgi:hypothetical protein